MLYKFYINDYFKYLYILQYTKYLKGFVNINLYNKCIYVIYILYKIMNVLSTSVLLLNIILLYEIQHTSIIYNNNKYIIIINNKLIIYYD